MTVLPPRLSGLRVAAAVAALVAALAGTAGCSGPAPASTPSPSHAPGSAGATSPSSPPVPAAMPSVGQCRSLVYSAISHYTNSGPTVPCTTTHTAYTFAVQTIPADVVVAGVSIGNKSIQDAASAGCRTAFATFIGGDPATRAQSRLSVTYFLPEQADFDAGAHWVRCDVVALKTSTALAPLPKEVGGYLNSSTALTEYGVCSQGAPGEAAAKLVMCSEPHTYRALTTLRLGADAAAYPGLPVTRTGGQQRCAAFIRSTLGAAGGYTFTWTYPTPTDWAAGQRFGYCWNKTHH